MESTQATWGPRTRDDDHVDTEGRNADLSAVTMFLFAKFLWRQGVSRCPATCAADAPQDECLCHCPDDVRRRVAPASSGAAVDVLAAAGAEALTNYLPRDPDGAFLRAGKGCEIPNFEGSYLGRFPLVLADSWTSDHLSDRSRP